MKKLVVLICLFSLAYLASYAQADKVLGYWLTEDGDSQVEIYKRGSKYYGKIVWLDEPNENGKPKVDDENPDPGLQNRPIMGLQLLKDFTYDGRDKEWQDGTIYDPKSGNIYDCYMWFEDDRNTLYIKGFVMGMRFLGRSTTWKREYRQRS